MCDKCHPISTLVKAGVCVVGEDIYYISNCIKLKYVTYARGPLTISPEHKLPSKIGDHVFTEEVKVFIAQTKVTKEERIKEQILKDIKETTKLENNDNKEYGNLRI